MSSSGVMNIMRGFGQVTSGIVSGSWHSYTSIFNPKARNTLGAAAIIGLVGYAAAQEELGAPSLGDIYKTAKDGTCSIIPDTLTPDYCTASAVNRAVLKALAND